MLNSLVYQDVFALAAVVSSLLVITSKNPVISVLFLISVFVNSAIYLMFTGISFIGISYIIVYVGAIAILFLFILMMINIQLTDILEVGTDYTKNLPIALIIGGLFIVTVMGAIHHGGNGASDAHLGLALLNTEMFSSILNVLNTTIIDSNISISDTSHGVSSFPVGGPVNTVALTIDPTSVDSYLRDYTQIESIGHNLYTNSAVLLILTSIILLLSMLAPIMLSSFYKKLS
jgi:NADH-ubiquinone oxidoreductase chain 6